VRRPQSGSGPSHRPGLRVGISVATPGGAAAGAAGAGSRSAMPGTLRTFIVLPSGRTMSPGFWPLQAPTHRAAVVMTISGGIVGQAGVPTRFTVSLVV
jgi:hypothetical protein